MTFSITPDTKIGDLLEAYPHLEAEFLKLSPAFKALKNPVLRRTVAKVATLRKASEMAGLPTPELVQALRRAAGLPDDSGPPSATVREDSARAAQDARPDWLDRAAIHLTIDAQAMLDRGEHPLGLARQTLRDAPDGAIIAIQSDFRPVPLIEAFESHGNLVYSEEVQPGKHHTYLRKA